MKKDIEHRADVESMVNAFYARVRKNAVIGPVFEEVARVDWDTHLPKMYAFWGNLLLDEQSYSGNPMIKHIALSKQTAMTQVEFSEWLALFTQTVDELFAGPKAEEAKTRAGNIARLMLHKINNQ